MCRSCGGTEERVQGPGFMAWTCARCGRASVRISDWTVWKRFRVLFERGFLVPRYEHRPTKVYTLRRDRTGSDLG